MNTHFLTWISGIRFASRLFANNATKTSICIGFLCFCVLYSNVEAQEVDIDFDALNQKISGFGGVNMPDWIDDMTVDQLNTAFGTGNGQLGLSILRIKVPMYREDWEREVPAAIQARSLGAIVLASPWSPPPYMKSNQSEVGGYLLPEYYSAFAAHLADFYQFMLSRGVEIYAMSLQNEPDIRVDYESCDWTSDQFRVFLSNYGSMIPTRIVVAESYNFGRAVTDPILNDPAAAAQVDIIGGHLYGGGLYSYPLAMNKGKEVWMTEHLDLGQDWRDSLATGKEIHDCLVSDFNAYIWWYIRRFYGLIDDDSQVRQRGYVMSHFSKFIRPGYYRVDADDAPLPGVSVSAYRDFDTAVIVAINQNPEPRTITLTLHGGDVAAFNRYQTTASENVRDLGTIPAGANFSITLPASSITTLNGSLQATKQYTNPVLPGAYPDLSLLQQGDDFYASSSSFQTTPYGEILHSRDLVNWETVSRAIPSYWPELISGAPAQGIRNSNIAYFYHSYWYYFSNGVSGGQYFCRARTPKGPWSAPVRMNTTPMTGESGYDDSIFVDDDGTPYLLIKAAPTANRIQRIGPDGHLTGEVINLDWIYQSGQYGLAEHPVICKRDGWYYYFVSEGQTGTLRALRSQSLSSDPANWEALGVVVEPVTDVQTGFRSPNRITSPVHLRDGSWWTLTQCYENTGADDWSGFGSQGILQQVTWDINGKPSVTAPTAQPVQAPNLLDGNIPAKTTMSDDFNELVIAPEWYFLDAESSIKYRFDRNPGHLRLAPGYGTTHLLQRESEHAYTVVTSLILGASSADQEGGILVTNGDQSLQVKLYSGYNGGKVFGFSFNGTTYQAPNTIGDRVWLKLVRQDHTLTGYCSSNGASWAQVGQPIQVHLLDSMPLNDNIGIGNSLGLYAQGNYADFDFFYYNEAADQGVGTWLEAECGQIGINWLTHDDASASHGQYVSPAAGYTARVAPTDPEAYLSYTFNIGEAGDYTLWMRAICPDWYNDSVWVQMDGGDPVRWNDFRQSDNWVWDRYPTTFALTAGNHTLRIAYNDNGVSLDKLVLFRSDDVPSGLGGNASNCGG